MAFAQGDYPAAGEGYGETVRLSRSVGDMLVEGAAVAGTGLEVWEIVRAYKEVGEDYGELRKGYPWLAEPQLRAALSYYELYPDEIETRLKLEESWTPERVKKEVPFAVPRLDDDRG